MNQVRSDSKRFKSSDALMPYEVREAAGID